MELIKQLKKLGLNHSESTVYLFLLQNGLSTPPIVSRQTKIARIICYNLLSSLEEKGIIDVKFEGKRKAYLARNPESIIGMLDVQRQAALNLIPDLEGMYTIHKNKPLIKYYVGLEQVKQIFLQSLDAPQITSISALKKLKIKLPDFFNYYNNQIMNRSIQLNEVKFATNSTVDLPTSVLLWGEHCAFLSLDEPVFGTVLMSKGISTTLRLLLNEKKSL